MNPRTGSMVIGLALLTVLATGRAQAQQGDVILARVDSVMSAAKDLTADQRMTLIEAGGRSKERLIRLYQKGTEKRLVRFLEPADVRGTGFLRLSDDRMYLYLPAFRRVRRIASSIKNDEFMGTDFSYEDVSQTTYGDDYSVTSVEQGEGRFILTLEPKPDSDVSYSRLRLAVDGSNWFVGRIEYFDARGKMSKTLEMTAEQKDGYWYPKRAEMVTLRTGHRTVLELENARFDTGLEDALFTERSLKRP